MNVVEFRDVVEGREERRRDDRLYNPAPHQTTDQCTTFPRVISFKMASQRPLTCCSERKR